MNRIKKVSRPAASLLALLLCVTLFASTAFAAGGALGADRNGTPYTYVIGYMYSGSSLTVNTREIFTSPNNDDIWLCPVCGRDPLGNSQGTALAADLYMPCYGYDIAAAGGDMSIRYALVRHRHNNGQLSDDRVCALPGFVDSKNEEKTERNAGYLVVSHSGGGMLRQGTRKGIRRTPANRGMRAHWVVKGLDISEDVCHGMCP